MQAFQRLFRMIPIVNILRFYLIFLLQHDKLAFDKSALAEKEEMNMKCKYCEAELAGWGGFCPVCGKNNAVDEEIELIPQEELEEETVLDETDLEETEAVEEETEDEEEKDGEDDEEEEEDDDEEEYKPSPKLKKAKRMAAMSGCVAVLAVLATVLFFGIRGGWEIGSLFDWLKPRENTIQYKDSYTVEDKKAVKKMDTVVATMGDMQLDNAQLQIYYWNEVYGFLGNYSYYLSYLGFDYTKPLSEQTCYFDETLTWEQYFLDSAMQVWQSNAAFAQIAKEKGFELPEDYQSDLDTMEADLTKTAIEGGYETLDAMVQESFGAGVTFADYFEYMEVYYLGYAYFEQLYNAIDPTDAEIEAYFTANEETLNGQGIKKDGSYTVDVRHILVMIDKVVAEMEKDESKPDAQDDDGDKTETESKYTEEQWAACLAAAQKIYDEWLAGDKTEEHFGELANKYSHDNNGKVTNGGIYTFVKKGEMVAEFNDWCFAEGRKPGDTDLVKTQFGYHVMYFVGSEETWFTQTRSAYISEQSNKIVEDALKQFDVEINYKKIVLCNVSLQ